MTTLAELRARFSPVLETIAAGALDRERERSLPVEAVRALAEAGFGTLRVPVEAGGLGATFPQLAALLVDLAAADSNLPQIWRGHIAFVEDLLVSPHADFRDRWLERIAGGAVIGNAWSEIGSVERGTFGTKITVEGDRAQVSGKKFYTTGSLFADFSDTLVEAADGSQHIAVVPLVQPGVTRSDDWDGFGQKLTGTGTIVYERAELEARDVIPFTDRFGYQTAVYQLVLVAVHAGIAAAVLEDTTAAVAARTRTYSHGNADRVREDPQILQILGEISAVAATSAALVEQVAGSIEAAVAATRRGSEEARAAAVEAELASGRAQIITTRLVPEAATRLFDTLGASAVREGSALDRHWRNARTVASHNPWVYKAREIGAFEVNGTLPGFQWSIGTVTAPSGEERAESAPVPVGA
ncbi:acyl-CoA dehydrogenase family protein [Brachybacterium massiliense]|uniref:acyl-CoA dehydrogenase family protein n=1 Tax=Brachybacterium massiliense TaxID=1755098 RepID=UPI000B3BB1C4|nr:acyl-CoA dehydrogenase family protein [Brachybacterium massiliense]